MISKYLNSPNYKKNLKSTLSSEDLSNNTSSYGNYPLRNQFNTHTYYYVDDYFTENELDNIIRYENKMEKEQSYVSHGDEYEVNDSIRNSELSWISPNEFSKWLFQKITRSVLEINKNFFEFDLSYLESIQLTRYNSNSSGMYTRHLDSGINFAIDGDRKLTMVIQLSDPEDYSGGDLLIYNSEEPIIVGKKKGRMIFFPSYMLHEVTPVTSGTRLTAVSWIVGPKFK